MLMGFDGGKDDLAFQTPRSWEMVSNLLNSVDDNVEIMYPMVAGLVGTGTAIEFRTWCKVWNSLPSIEDVFDGKMPIVPNSTDALYALVSAMAVYAQSHKDEMQRIANSIVYAEKLPADFSAVLLKDYMYIEDGYKSKLMQIPEFAKWLQTKGRLLNGTV